MSNATKVVITHEKTKRLPFKPPFYNIIYDLTTFFKNNLFDTYYNKSTHQLMAPNRDSVKVLKNYDKQKMINEKFYLPLPFGI